jgi:hypothetical protein
VCVTCVCVNRYSCVCVCGARAHVPVCMCAYFIRLSGY